MKAMLMILCLTCVLAAPAQSVQPRSPREAPPSKEARDLLARAVDLAGRDRVDDAVAAVRRAIALAPTFLDAHVRYIRLRASFQGELDAVKAEYADLMARQPDNPIYPLALFLGGVHQGPDDMLWLRRVVALAPDSSGGHFAQSYVILGRTWEMMNEGFEGKGPQLVEEALKAVDANAGVEFYERAIHLQEIVDGADAAILTAQKMASRPDLRADGLREVWRLRLLKARGSQQAKDDLTAELKTLSSSAKDVSLLAAAREACLSLLKDRVAAEAIERQILRLDPAWYPDRGRAILTTVTNATDLPYAILAANRQYALWDEAEQIVLAREADWRKETAALEALLTRHPNPALEKWIVSLQFASARRAGEIPAMIGYANRIARIDPTDTAPFARVALAMAGHGTDLPTALEFARRAERAVAEFHPMTQPPGVPAQDFARRFTVEQQQASYRTQRALALHATGTVLLRMGRAAEAGDLLQQSVTLDRANTSLAHLADALEQLGRHDEALALRGEDDEKITADVRKRFTNRPAADFDLEATDGRRYRLSDLKGKIVLVNFWATWCGPCVGEMPLLATTYEKYKAQGLEILAVSADEATDRGLVKQFAEGHGLRFPVLYDEGVAKRYGVDGYPVTVFIDRQGNIRYQESGAFEASGRRLEIILAELLKAPGSAP
jgi:peroxiredoxin